MTSISFLGRLFGSKRREGVQNTREQKLAQLRNDIGSLRNHVNDMEKHDTRSASADLFGTTSEVDRLTSLIEAGDKKSLKDGKKVASHLGTGYIAQAYQLLDSFNERIQPNSPEHKEMMKWKKFHISARGIEKQIAKIAKMSD